MRLPCGLLIVVPACAALLGSAAPAAPGAEAGSHWAWSPPSRPAVPLVRDRSWARGPIDLFLLERLEEKGIPPAPEASREELIRRVTFDLTGLPPEPSEIDAFVLDPADDAWERVVDRLLASPRHGERWGRHWLDLARFAESNGFEQDELRPDAWRYRDYVIRSFNADKPYDRFVAEQIAGDELHPEDPDALAATGFNVLGPDMTDASDQAQRRYNTICDMTDTSASVFLGLTLGCARCHDHKLEPFTQVDYFRLQAFFASARLRSDVVVAPREDIARYEAALKAYREVAGPIEEAIAELERPHRARLREQKLSRIADEAQAAHRTPPAQRTAVQKELAERTERLLTVSQDEVVRALDAHSREKRVRLLEDLKALDGRKPPPLPTALGLSSPAGEAARAHVLERGDLKQPGVEVSPGVPAVLERGALVDLLEAPGPAAQGRRAALAKWVTHPRNPLAARVIVNRLWQRYFGRGLVGTPSDFGLRGDPPSNAKLLDWLAVELIERGWSLKALHREILLSAAYRQSSIASSAARAGDPENLLVSRQSRRRLEAEAIRDSWLAAAGILDTRMGGPGARPGGPGAGAKEKEGARTRRSIYLHVRRNLRHALFEGLDVPDTNATCPKRDQSTTAAQALTLLNSPEANDAAEALAKLLVREAASPAEQVELAFRRVLGRRPTPEEAADVAEHLKASPLREVVRALFNCNEALYVD